MAYHYYIYRRGAGYCGEHFSSIKKAQEYCRDNKLQLVGYRIERTSNGHYSGCVENQNGY